MGELMTTDVITVGPDATVRHALRESSPTP
jgi:CBS domain-containing protein